MRDPITGITDPPTSTTVAQTTSTAVSAPKRSNAGLGTGPSVYLGIDIPCASIHLHSDPEGNIEPALALTLTNRELRRKLKKKYSTVVTTGEEVLVLPNPLSKKAVSVNPSHAEANMDCFDLHWMLLFGAQRLNITA